MFQQESRWFCTRIGVANAQWSRGPTLILAFIEGKYFIWMNICTAIRLSHK